MRWKTKESTKNTEWHRVFVWNPIKPVKTLDGYTVIFEHVWRRWKVQANNGYYVYRVRVNEII